MVSVRVEEDRQTGVTIVEPMGRLDSGQIDELERVLLARIAGGQRHLVVDFGATLFIASSALRVVLVAHRKVLALKGRFLLCSMPGPIADVFQVSGFRKFLEIEPDRATAVRRAMPEGYVPPEPGPAPGRGLGAAAVAAQARPGSILDARERTARRPGVFRRILRFLFG